MTARGTASKLRRRLAGLGYFAVIIAFLGSQVLIYQKVFTPAVHVLLRTDHVGNQLQPPSDVKIRGMVVGEVREIRATGSGAELDLALQPDKVDRIPRDVSARLLPKTLFGERYVSLVAPHSNRPVSARTPLAEGDVIGQDRSSTSIEVERVLSSLMPMLQAVRPDQLATTLNSVSMALDGRGDQLGNTLVGLNEYLKRLNPSLPDLTHDLRALGDVSNSYAQAGPEIVQALSDLTTTTRTVVQQRENLDGLFRTVTTASDDADAFLRDNKENLIDLSASSRPALELLGRYSPEYPCVLGGLADLAPEIDRAAGKGTDKPYTGHIMVEITSGSRKYEPGKDDPSFSDTRGPRCYPTPPPGQNARFEPLDDGVSAPTDSTGSTTRDQGAPSAPSSGQKPASTAPAAAAGFPAQQMANSHAEQQLMSVLLARRLGARPADVPQWSSLLVGPVFRGAEVTVR